MTVGERIKQRRKELGISVDELAEKLQKNRATIYRYESSEIEKLPTTVLEPLAIALQTTPAFLMGWEHRNIDFNPIIDENQPITAQSLSKGIEKVKDMLLELGETLYDAFADDPTYILQLYSELNHSGKKEALKRVMELTEIERYKKQEDAN